MSLETHTGVAYGLLHSERRILVGPVSWLAEQNVEIKDQAQMRELYRNEELWMYYAPSNAIAQIVPRGSAYALTHDGRFMNPARLDPGHVRHM